MAIELSWASREVLAIVARWPSSCRQCAAEVSLGRAEAGVPKAPSGFADVSSGRRRVGAPGSSVDSHDRRPTRCGREEDVDAKPRRGHISGAASER
jgi:hypothetical protein